MSFRKRLKEEITYNGLLLKEVADKAGIPKRTLDTYVDKREIIPPADVAVRLAKVLDVTVEYLVTGETKATTNNKRPEYWYLNLIRKTPDEIIEINKMYKKVQQQQNYIEQLQKYLNPEEDVDPYLESDDLAALIEVSKMQEQKIKKLEIEKDFRDGCPPSLFEERPDFIVQKILTLQDMEHEGILDYDLLAEKDDDMETECQELFDTDNIVNKIKSLKEDEVEVILKILDSFSKNKETRKRKILT